MKIAISEARKYSVPLQAAIIREFLSFIPRRSNRSVCFHFSFLMSVRVKSVKSSEVQRQTNKTKFKTYSVICNEVNTSNLLETLRDDSKTSTTEVLTTSVSE